MTMNEQIVGFKSLGGNYLDNVFLPALNNFIFCLTNIFLLSKKDRQVKIELTTTFFGKCLYLLLRDIDPNTHTHTHKTRAQTQVDFFDIFSHFFFRICGMSRFY